MDNCGDDEQSNPEESTNGDEPNCRAKCHSQRPYTGQTDNPKKLGFYPPQWWDILEGGQLKIFQPWMAYECGFPIREDEDHMVKAI
jgi:hypothetical protein